MTDDLRESVDEIDDPPEEAIPDVPSSAPPKKKRGWPKGVPRGARKKPEESVAAKLPIPPAALKALGTAPFLLAGQLYNVQTKRSLDFNNPPEVAAMYQASLQALEEWMKEAGVEAPAWLVWAGTTSMCIGSAIAVDQMKLAAEKSLADSLRAAPKNGATEPPKTQAPSSVVISD